MLSNIKLLQIVILTGVLIINKVKNFLFIYHTYQQECRRRRAPKIHATSLIATV